MRDSTKVNAARARVDHAYDNLRKALRMYYDLQHMARTYLHESYALALLRMSINVTTISAEVKAACAAHVGAATAALAGRSVQVGQDVCGQLE